MKHSIPLILGMRKKDLENRFDIIGSLVASNDMSFRDLLTYLTQDLTKNEKEIFVDGLLFMIIYTEHAREKEQ